MDNSIDDVDLIGEMISEWIYKLLRFFSLLGATQMAFLSLALRSADENMFFKESSTIGQTFNKSSLGKASKKKNDFF